MNGWKAAAVGLLGAASSWAHAAPVLADAPAPVGRVKGVVSITQDGAPKADRSGIVVYLEKVPGPVVPEKKALHQKDLQFTPGLMVVPRGSVVEFPNDDKVFHNVFSLSRGSRFDLGLYKSGESKSVEFKNAGVVDVYCNIHPQMVAKIKVIDSNHFGVTDAEGKFAIEKVPPGTYPIVGWQPYGDEFHGEITVKTGGSADVQIALVAGDAPQRHLRKDGTPYGAYK